MKKLLFHLLKYSAPKEWIDDYVRLKWVRPPDFTDLTLAFVDTLGRKWYEYPTASAIPLQRMDAQLRNVGFLSAMISGEQMTETRADINKALAHGDMVGAGAIFSRFFDNAEKVVPMDIMINLIALTLVREDELPDRFDQATHSDKCDFLKAAIERGDGFFFRLTEVKRLSGAFKIGEDHWAMLSQRSKELNDLRKREREAILSRLSEKE